MILSCMTGEVTSLSPESMICFIFSPKGFRLRDYHLLKCAADDRTVVCTPEAAFPQESTRAV